MAIKAVQGASLFTNPFWMVVGEEGPTKTQHLTEHEAVAEAERLAKLTPNQYYYVMKTICFVVQTPAPATRYDF